MSVCVCVCVSVLLECLIKDGVNLLQFYLFR